MCHYVKDNGSQISHYWQRSYINGEGDNQNEPLMLDWNWKHLCDVCGYPPYPAWVLTPGTSLPLCVAALLSLLGPQHLPSGSPQPGGCSPHQLWASTPHTRLLPCTDALLSWLRLLLPTHTAPLHGHAPHSTWAVTRVPGYPSQWAPILLCPPDSLKLNGSGREVKEKGIP